MSKPSPKRPPNPTLRWVLMLAGVIVVFGGVFAIKAFFAKQTDNFFDNMPQPAVAVSSAVAKVQRWSDDGEAVGTFVAVNGTDVTTEAGGVVRSLSIDVGKPVKAGTVLAQLNTANELAVLKSLEASAKLAAVQRDRWQALARDKLVSQAEAEERATVAATSLAQVEAAARAGAWCLGAVAYEAAAVLEADLPTQPATTALAWLAQFAAPVPQTASACLLYPSDAADE